MNSELRGLDSADNFPENAFFTIFPRPAVPNQTLEGLMHTRANRNSDSEERPLTSTGRRLRRHIEEEITHRDEITLGTDEVLDGNENDSINVHGQHSHGTFNSIFLSFIEQLQSNFEDELNQGLPQEMIDKLKRMKMGKSAQDCSVCSESFKRGEKIRKLPCKHIFHENCIMPWLEKKSTCPNCRFDLFEFFTENPDEDY